MHGRILQPYMRELTRSGKSAGKCIACGGKGGSEDQGGAGGAVRGTAEGVCQLDALFVTLDRTGFTLDCTGLTLDRTGFTLDRTCFTLDRTGFTLDRTGSRCV
jgi:hypothetical protein